MNPLGPLLDGFALALAPEALVWSLAGVTVGTLVGVLPGVGPALTIALLLPLTYQVDAAYAFMLFAGIYYGAMYGGSTAAILLNTPGETASLVTALEGHKMARRGRAGAALMTAAIGSFVAGTLGTVALTFLAGPVVTFALAFGPAEYFALMVLAFVTVSATLTSSVLKGLVSLAIGVLLGMVGIDLQTGQPRFAFGVPELLGGIDVVVVAVGLFAVGETFHLAAGGARSGDGAVTAPGRLRMTAAEWQRSWKAWLRGACIGFPLGAIPAGGSELPTFLSYWTERKLSRHRAEFGNGAIEGVAGPEAANNAATAGVLVPLLALGLPTSATAAIMLSAFQSYGIQPGPTLLSTQPGLVWGLIASLYIANVLLLALNLPLVGLWVRLLAIPRPLLQAGILTFATLGTWGIGRSVVDLWLLFGIGFVGFLMRRFDFPLAPVIIGMILGPLAEQEFRRAMTLGQGELAFFLERPLALALFAIAAVALAGPGIWRVLRRARHAQADRII
jgi:putative tricarboxylic transport membrane protein